MAAIAAIVRLERLHSLSKAPESRLGESVLSRSRHALAQDPMWELAQMALEDAKGYCRKYTQVNPDYLPILVRDRATDILRDVIGREKLSTSQAESCLNALYLEAGAAFRKWCHDTKERRVKLGLK